MLVKRVFQSTHPVRGGTALLIHGAGRKDISIHPPREGWDVASAGGRGIAYPISIHPPREGWDLLQAVVLPLFFFQFQSTHPVRGGTSGANVCPFE